MHTRVMHINNDPRNNWQPALPRWRRGLLLHSLSLRDSNADHVDGYSKAPLTHERAPITPWGCQRRWSCDYHLISTCTAMFFFLLTHLTGLMKQPEQSSGFSPPA
jgi:hypothetical protein